MALPAALPIPVLPFTALEKITLPKALINQQFTWISEAIKPAFTSLLSPTGFFSLLAVWLIALLP
jgi:hypothetical protein